MVTLAHSLRKTLDILLPNRCLLCQQPSQSDTGLCLFCHVDIRYFDYQRFDNLLMQPDIKAGLKQIRFDRLISLAPYQWPFDQWLVNIKFNQKFNLARSVGQQLAKLLCHLVDRQPQCCPDVIIPMPIHYKRRFVRGYNQAALIAQELARRLNLPIDNRSVTRIKATQAQSGLGAKQRKNNVKQAFRYRGPSYRHVAIVDDVITTGATVNALCRELKKHRVGFISVWTICATPKQRYLGKDKKGIKKG